MEGLRTPPQGGLSPEQATRPQKVQKMLLPNQPILDRGLSPALGASPCPAPQVAIANKLGSDDLNQKITQINQAKNALEDILSSLDNIGSKALFIDGILALEAIVNQIQSPQEIRDQDLDPMERLVYKMHLDLAKVSDKVDQILEKPTYAEIVQTASLRPNQPPIPRSNQPPSPRVVIPLRKDLEQGNYPLESPSSSPRPSPRLGQERGRSIKARRLILKVPLEFLDNLNPMQLRDQINDKFFTSGIDKPIVATIGKSVTNLSLVMTTTEDFSGSYLIEKGAVWKGIIPYTSISHDAEWTKLIVHTVPTKPFSMDDGESLMRSEIETFNPKLKLMRNPIWLSKEENRAGKYHSSILIHLPNQEMAKLALESRITMAGVICRVEKYIPKHTQCDKCQKFGHTRAYCTNEVKCRVCSLNHEGKDHFCQIYQVRDQEYPYSILKCANCGKNHKADDKKCQLREKYRPRFTRPTPRARSDSMDIDQ